MNAAGRMSDAKRNEGQLLCDILGLESLVDEITYKLASTAADEPTATAILGPFYRHDAPKLPMGSCIVSKEINEQGDRIAIDTTIFLFYFILWYPFSHSLSWLISFFWSPS